MGKVIVLFEILKTSGLKFYEFQCFDLEETDIGPLIKLNKQISEFKELVLQREAPAKVIKKVNVIGFQIAYTA